MRMSSVSHDSGFTLMELLVALTLLAILMTTMLGGLRLGARVWEVSVSSLDDSDHVFVVRRFLQQRLEDVVPVIRTDQTGADQPAFIGEAASLRLASSMPISLGQGLFLLDLSLHPSDDESGGRNLVLGWTSFPAETFHDRSERMILENITGMTMAYYARTEEDPSGRWYPSWRGRDLLPELIRIDLQFPPGDRRQWQPLIVSPMIDEWFDTRF
ncbi:MAG: prepilin-type N-terminal cleavage/methylation domain-containing protein [Geminicoccaceae bacterium]